jgi:hypothetical protein
MYSGSSDRAGRPRMWSLPGLLDGSALLRIWRKEANMAVDDRTFDGDNTRQGVTGHHVRHVLAFSVAAVVLAFIFVAVVT